MPPDEPSPPMKAALGSLGAALHQGPVMADGGLSTVLGELGAPPLGPGTLGAGSLGAESLGAASLGAGALGAGSALGPGEVLATRPTPVEEAHVRMLRAGAQVVLAAGYQVSRLAVVASGRRPEDADALLVEATRRAVAARDRVGAHERSPWVAASIGPYGAALGDGSEYRGRYDIGRNELAEFHRERLEVWVEAQRHRSTRADVWWCETIPDGVEIMVLADGLADSLATLVERGLPAPEIVMTMTVGPDGRCPTGEPVGEALAPVLDAAAWAPVAVGVNCCDPADVADALERLSAVTPLPLVAKPNLGGVWDAAAGRFQRAGTFTPDPERLRQWTDGRARLIGGCCGTGTAGLADLARRLSAH